jgi:hypothetical protein
MYQSVCFLFLKEKKYVRLFVMISCVYFYVYVYI